MRELRVRDDELLLWELGVAKRTMKANLWRRIVRKLRVVSCLVQLPALFESETIQIRDDCTIETRAVQHAGWHFLSLHQNKFRWSLLKLSNDVVGSAV